MSLAVKQGRYPLSFCLKNFAINTFSKSVNVNVQRHNQLLPFSIICRCYAKDTSSGKYNEQDPTIKKNLTNVLDIGPGCETVKAHLSSMGRWFDKVALVTGASGVIGSAVTVKLAQRGMKVVGCDIHLEPIQEIRKEWERKHGAGKIVAYSCDLTIDDHVLDMFRHIKEQLGGVDVMVCCAEYFPRNSLGAVNCDMKMWRKVINSNVVSPALCTVETVRSIDERGVEEGHIVLLGHMSGIHIDPRESMHVYSVTKYSYNAMVEAFRHALIVHELPIRITQIIPSVVDSRSMNTGVSPLINEPLSGVDIANTVEYVLSTPLHCQINDVVIRPTEEED
uniref:Uncharacterized protein n=1 Tax=Timema poppense TaxID=170557 RepID=A0A7R9H6V7_TIMPO|nr:unnamed protein product [Timema poppensis]